MDDYAHLNRTELIRRLQALESSEGQAASQPAKDALHDRSACGPSCARLSKALSPSTSKDALTR